MADVDIRDLTVEFSAGGYVVRPLHEFNLAVPGGSLAIVLGPSGSGKTTLLSCLAGILRPTRGTIRVGDVDVPGLRGRQLTAYRRRTVGVVFQAFNLVASLSASENVAAPLWGAGVGRREARTRAEELLGRVGLQDRSRHRPGDLSGGQQQRVAIARALAHDPSLVLADEPTAHLDYVQVETVLRILREIASEARTVVVATHDERMLPLADEVVELVPRFTSGWQEPVRQELADGEVLFEEGSWGDRIYVVGRGEISILRRGADGGDEVIATVEPGDYFGEMGPLFRLPRSATARARGSTVVTGYTVQAFRDEFGVERLGAVLGLAADRRVSPAGG